MNPMAGWHVRAPARRSRLLLCALVVTVATGLASLWRPPHGLVEELHDAPGLGGRVLRTRIAPGPSLDGLHETGLPRRHFSVRWRGYWFVARDGAYDVHLGADDAATVSIDGRLVHERNEAVGFGTTRRTIRLGEGSHAIEVTYEQLAGGSFLNVLVAPAGGTPAPLPRSAFFPSKPRPHDLLVTRALAWSWCIALLLAAAAAGASVAGSVRETVDAARARGTGPNGLVRGALGEAARRLASPVTRRALGAVLALAITIFGAILRLDALYARYGPVEAPRWAWSLGRAVEDLAPYLQPAPSWEHVDDPYVGGDPLNYLRFAREMRDFYQAHAREPVFLATTRAFLGLLDDQDVAVSFASALFGVLLVPATFVLGWLASGLTAATVAALALAGEFTAISWSVDGWRDEAAALFVVLIASAMLALRDRRGDWHAVTFGVVSGLATLTRITSFLVWVPALAMALTGPRPWHSRIRAGLVALALATALGLPFLVNCARVFGDPLYAVNVHTSFYRARERTDADLVGRESAAAYVSARLREEPARTLDTAIYGLTVQPFANKWTGLAPWGGYVPTAFRWAALVGLWLLALDDRGRPLLAIGALAVLPFAFTWNIEGGSEWRFTLAAYPFYLVAAGVTVQAFATAGRRLLAHRRLGAVAWLRARLDGVIASGALVGLVATALAVLPMEGIRERVAAGRAVRILPHTREAGVLAAGWNGAATAACAPLIQARARIALPLPAGRPSHVRLHLQHAGVPGPREIRVRVTSGPATLGRLALRSNDRNQDLDLVVPDRLVGGWTTPLEVEAFAPDDRGESPRRSGRADDTTSVPPVRLCAVTVSRGVP